MHLHARPCAGNSNTIQDGENCATACRDGYRSDHTSLACIHGSLVPARFTCSAMQCTVVANRHATQHATSVALWAQSASPLACKRSCLQTKACYLYDWTDQVIWQRQAMLGACHQLGVTGGSQVACWSTVSSLQCREACDAKPSCNAISWTPAADGGSCCLNMCTLPYTSGSAAPGSEGGDHEVWARPGQHGGHSTPLTLSSSCLHAYAHTRTHTPSFPVLSSRVVRHLGPCHSGPLRQGCHVRLARRGGPCLGNMYGTA